MVKNEYYPDGSLKSTYIVDPDNTLPPDGMSPGLREQLRHPLMKAAAGSEGGSNLSKDEIQRQLAADVSAYARRRAVELQDAEDEFQSFFAPNSSEGQGSTEQAPPDNSGIDLELQDLLER